MDNKRNTSLIVKVLALGALIAVLSYLFHPDIGQLSVTLNGQPIPNPLVSFAAIPTFLLVMGISVVLTVLLFLGIGALMFLGALFIGLGFCMVLAPYFWPVLVIIFLAVAVMSLGDNEKS